MAPKISAKNGPHDGPEIATKIDPENEPKKLLPKMNSQIALRIGPHEGCQYGPKNYPKKWPSKSLLERTPS